MLDGADGQGALSEAQRAGILNLACTQKMHNEIYHSPVWLE